MLIRSGLTFTLIALFMQLAVFLSPFLPTQYRLQEQICVKLEQIHSVHHTANLSQPHQHSLQHSAHQQISVNHSERESDKKHSDHPCYVCVLHVQLANLAVPVASLVHQPLFNTKTIALLPQHYTPPLLNAIPFQRPHKHAPPLLL